MFAHVLDSEHAGIAETMIDLGLRERAFNGFFSSCVDRLAFIGLGKGNDIIQSILPNMSFHHPSGHTLAKAFFALGAILAGLAVAAVLAVAFTGGGFPVEMLMFRTGIRVEVWIVFEAVFAVVFSLVGVTSVANDTL